MFKIILKNLMYLLVIFGVTTKELKLITLFDHFTKILEKLLIISKILNSDEFWSKDRSGWNFGNRFFIRKYVHRINEEEITNLVVCYYE